MEEYIVLILLITSVFGIFLFNFTAERGILERWISGLVPPLLAIAIIAGMLNAPGYDWNVARLSPTFAIAKGYKLYYGLDSDPILNHLIIHG